MQQDADQDGADDPPKVMPMPPKRLVPPITTEAIYCMTKAGLNHLTRCLAAEWAPPGITVNSVAPTFIHTDGTKPALSDPTFHQRTLAHIPLGRIGHTDDVVGAVVFLASPAASLITGTNLLDHGGRSVA